MNPLTISRPTAGAGLAWVKAGWRLFMLAPVPWTGMTALVFLILIAVGMVPAIGPLAVHILSPLIVAGYLAASRGGEAGEPISFIYLSSGWRDARQPLLVIGAVYMVGTLLLFQLLHAMTGSNVQELLAQTQNPADLTPEQAEQILSVLLPAMGIGSLLFAPLLMATWFAPGLALFEGFPAGRAMWWSLWACWVNWRPILFYSLLLGLAGMVAIQIPYDLGLLVFLPWTLTSTYAAYQDIFCPATQPQGVTELA